MNRDQTRPDSAEQEHRQTAEKEGYIAHKKFMAQKVLGIDYDVDAPTSYSKPLRETNEEESEGPTTQFVSQTSNPILLGWNMTHPQYGHVAALIAEYMYRGFFNKYMETCPDGPFVERLNTAGVLNLWFTPIYKPVEKTMTIVLTMGNHNDEVHITKHTILFKNRHRNWSVATTPEEVKHLLKSIKSADFGWGLGDQEVSICIQTDDRFIMIGKPHYGQIHKFSYDELEEILNHHEKLQ